MKTLSTVKRLKLLKCLTKRGEKNFNAVWYDKDLRRYIVGAVEKGNAEQYEIWFDEWGNADRYRIDISDFKSTAFDGGDKIVAIADAWLIANYKGELDDNHRYPCSYVGIEPMADWDHFIADLTN